MKVILVQPVKNLGPKNTIIEVKDGYGRNFLLPKKLAVLATPGAKRHLEMLKGKEEKTTKQIQAQAKEFTKKLAGQTIELSAKAGEKGKLFGSITAEKLAQAVSKTLGTAIPAKMIELTEELKTTGSHTAKLKFGAEAAVTLKISITPEPEKKK